LPLNIFWNVLFTSLLFRVQTYNLNKMSREVEMQCNQVDVTLAFKLMQYGHTLCTGNTKESSDTRWSLGSLFKIVWQPNFGLQHKGYKSLI